MMPHGRRRLLQGIVAGIGAGSLAVLSDWRSAQAADTPRIIPVSVRRFAFSPSEIALKAGETVVLEVTSIDFVHGMNFPDFNIRADLVPGKITRIALPAQAAGTYEFLCDNFCGDGHEGMHGKLVVTN